MTTQTTTPAALGTQIGRAIARDVLAEDMPRAWTGLDAQDGDRLIAAGIQPDTDAWAVAEQAAREAYLAQLRAERL